MYRLKFVSLVVLIVVFGLILSNPLAQPAGGTLTIASTRELSSLNPISDDPQALELMPLFLGTLLEVNPINAQIEPALAERLPQVSPDGKSFTLTLRNIKFSDGTPFTADDVLFTFHDVLFNTRVRTRTLDELREFFKVGGQSLWQRAERVDERTVRFLLNAPLPTSFLVLLAQIPILPKHKLEKRDVARAWGVGTRPEEIAGLGPFRIKELGKTGIPLIGERISPLVLERNPFYWKRDAQGAPLPRLQQITWLGGQRESLKQFQEGKIDLFEPTVEEALALPTTAQLIRGGSQVFFILLMLNQDVTEAEKRMIFRDVRFRQALAHATDRAAFVQKYPGGLAAPRESFLHPLSPFYREASLVRYPFDLAKAAALLDQAGLKDADGDGWRDLPSKKPFTLVFLLVRDGDPVRHEIAKLYQENLGRIGLKVELELTSRDDWRGRIFAKPPRYEVVMVTYQFELFDIIQLIWQLKGLFSSSGEFHTYRPSDATGQGLTEIQKQIDEILTQLPGAPDAYALFARLQKLLSEDVPVLPLYSPQYLVAVQPSVKHAEVINAYGYARFLELLSRE
ncbi:MAG: ABC transporter substrate-binding protein [Candidatus Methanomethylicaceae archaeon]